MKTLKGLIAGSALVALASAMNGCAPAVVASRPYPVHYPDPVPVQTVAVPVASVVPVVPVWAPPYAYVTQVRYYYFPDYMVYYDVFASNYCYYNGYSWLHVALLPSMPFYYGFNPYNSYLVVLNRHIYDPWMNHTYYTQQYPTGYYQTAYMPRTTLGDNTVLRAFDENQSKPLFVDKRSNKEVKVQYTEIPRTQVNSNANERKSTSVTGGRTAAVQSTSSEKYVPVNDRVKNTSAANSTGTTESMRSSQGNKETREKIPATRSQATPDHMRSSQGHPESRQQISAARNESSPDRVRTDNRKAETVRANEERKPANTQVQETRQRTSAVRPAESSERSRATSVDKRSNEQDRSAVKSEASETRTQVTTGETQEKVHSKRVR